jgi:flagellar hook-associated protein 1 FlgK
MSGLFTSLRSTVVALTTYTKVLDVMQNNIANASTAGYAKQMARLEAMPFDVGAGLPGGVALAAVDSARDLYAEQSVRRETTSLGAATQQTQSLQALESIFGISSKSGIPHALNELFDSFSAWAQSPTDGAARQNVIDRAADLAAAFNQTASSLSRITADAT